MSWDSVDTLHALEDTLRGIRARALELADGGAEVTRDALLGLATSAADALNTIGGEDGYDEDRQRYCPRCAQEVDWDRPGEDTPACDECRSERGVETP